MLNKYAEKVTMLIQECIFFILMLNKYAIYVAGIINIDRTTESTRNS